MFLKIEQEGGAHLWEADKIFYTGPIEGARPDAMICLLDPTAAGQQHRVFCLEPQGLRIGTDQRAYILNENGKTIDVFTPWDRPR
jgi:hypothetical protein